MRKVEPISMSVVENYRKLDESQLTTRVLSCLDELNKKMVVLDDDPTGIQTVNKMAVYTKWDIDSIRRGFAEEEKMFFILTNSRSFTSAEAKAVYTEIAENVVQVSKETGMDFIIVCRGDSTLRGHYPLEGEVVRDVIEEKTGKKMDGEIIIPYFEAGGRYTLNNIHYCKDGDMLIPAGMTEFAKDKTFGYEASDLGEWCEEKTEGRFKAKDMIYISLDDLRDNKLDEIADQLRSAKDFNKIIVNAIADSDMKVFVRALIRAYKSGKNFQFRTAAGFLRILGGVRTKPLLTKAELVSPEDKNGGIVIIGSHVKKTTMQFEELKNCKYPLEYIEFNASLVLVEGGLEKEVARCVKEAEEKILQGKTVVVYTSRQLVQIDTTDKDKILSISVRISNALTSIIGELSIKPNFIIAKGGITSSDVGTKALKVVRATVMGQIKPGIPVWMTGPESKFPNMPYVIFPGNVGEVTTLREAVEVLMGE